MEKTKFYLAGQWSESPNSIEIRNPYNNQIIAEVFLATQTQVLKAIEITHSCKSILYDLGNKRRSEILKEIAKKLEKNKILFAETICKESAKPYKYALIEVERAITCFELAATECLKIKSKKINIAQTAAGKNKNASINFEPCGVIAGISPFNFPLNLAVHKIAPAIAAACPIILKPSSLTPLSTLLLAQLIDTTDLPKGALSILPCTREVGFELVTHSKINFLSFTGSDEIGWKLKQQCGKKKCTLELGGNAATIITENFDFTKYLQKLATSAFAYSGQICIHAQRFYIHESIFDSFILEMKKIALTLKQDNPLNKNCEISVVIDLKNAERLEAWMNEAIQQGAKLICGGKRIQKFIEPSIFTSTNSTMKINAEEVFGPIICIEKFNTINEAVKLVNESKYGLQTSIFTNNSVEKDFCVRKIESGTVLINEVTIFRVDSMPYGGVKDSGIGREGISFAIEEMLEKKLIIE